MQLRPLAFATFLVWRLRIGACGVGACGFWALKTATRLFFQKKSKGHYQEDTSKDFSGINPIRLAAALENINLNRMALVRTSAIARFLPKC